MNNTMTIILSKTKPIIDWAGRIRKAKEPRKHSMATSTEALRNAHQMGGIQR